MNIRPCPADRTRALARLRKGRAERVRRRTSLSFEVTMTCGCIVDVDFNDPILVDLFERAIHKRMIK